MSACSCSCSKTDDAKRVKTVVPSVPPPPSHIFLVVPSSRKFGEDGSAVYSGYRNSDGSWVILGADCYEFKMTEGTNEPDFIAMLMLHIMRVRSLSHTRNAKLVVIGGCGIAYSYFLNRFSGGNIVFMSDGTYSERSGVWMGASDESKTMTRALCKADAVRVSLQLYTLGNVAETRDKLCSSLDAAAHGIGDPVSWLQCLLYFGTEFLDNDKYAAVR